MRPLSKAELEQLQRWFRLSTAKRLRAMLEARALAMGIIRGRIRRQHPELSQREINLLVLEEISRRER